jgi:hypothetical protein
VRSFAQAGNLWRLIFTPVVFALTRHLGAYLVTSSKEGKLGSPSSREQPAAPSAPPSATISTRLICLFIRKDDRDALK